ncbi:hypothetical protein DY000_02022464 [Brassica cretica]|uniref:Uncharacterized protein n=1 Tax=Brassica cretica TaxID=69181 RepID=A0ABQ7EAI6_BRACR|nr:hypothetical protein DY000_02022464 [Brassica cretica]
MVEMRTEIESLRQQLEKEATTSASIDAPHVPSIDVSLPTAQIPAEPQCSAEHKDEWEVSYINTRMNDVYYPLNNNANSSSINRLQGPCIDGKNLVELLPYTAAESLFKAITELGFIGACHCGAEYESEYETGYSESIDTPTFPSIDSNESTVTDDRNNTSLDVDQPVDHFATPNHCYPHFAFQPPSKRGRDDFSIVSWADSGFHESFAVDTVITSPNEEHTEEYDEDYLKERAIEISLQDERLETHKFTTTFPTSLDEEHSTSVDTHPRPAKQPLTSINTHTGTSIDIRAAAKIQEQENIPSPTRFIDTYIKRFAPLKPPPHTRADTQAEKMNTLPSTSTGKSMKSNHLKNTSSAEITLPSIDASVSTSIDTTLNPNLSISKLNDNANIDYGFLTPDEFGIFRDPDGNARAIDGRILQVSREDIADILQVANGPDNLFSQQQLSAYAYDNIGWHQVSIDNVQDRLQNISNALKMMDE